MWEVGIICLVALLVVVISHWFYSWVNPNCKNGKLPPGSMGLPIIGETFQFFSSHSFYDISPFMSKRIARYGHLFRSNLIGRKVVVCTDPEINYKVLRQENESLVLWYTDSLVGIVGSEDDLMAHHGSAHKYLKNLLVQAVGPEMLRTKMLHKVDEATRKHLHSWASNGRVDIKNEAAHMIFDSFAKNLLSYDDDEVTKTLVQSFEAFMNGFISIPLYIPGTAFYACIQGRKKAIKVIKNMYQERKASKMHTRTDFLDRLLEEAEKENTIIDENNALNLIFVILLATYEAPSQALALLTKFVFEHPKVLDELTKEHDVIAKKRVNKNSGVTWEEYKSMTFTHMVINEIVRLANIAPILFRKVIKDMEINGYTIPAGWLFLPFTSIVHLDPEKYENPLEFNPWRWEGKELHCGSKTFMAFGGSARLCVGAEYSKLQMSIYLHYLITKYRWSVIKGGEVVRKPLIVYADGLHIALAEKTPSD